MLATDENVDRKVLRTFSEDEFWTRVSAVLRFLDHEWNGYLGFSQKTEYKHPGQLNIKPQPNRNQRTFSLVELKVDLVQAYQQRDLEAAVNLLAEIIKVLNW